MTPFARTFGILTLAAIAGCGWSVSDRRGFDRLCEPEFGDRMCRCLAERIEQSRVRVGDLGTSLLDSTQSEKTAQAIDGAIAGCASLSMDWPPVYRTRIWKACSAEGYPDPFCQCFVDGVAAQAPWPDALEKLGRGKVLAIPDTTEFEQRCLPFAGDRWWPGAIQGAAEGCRARGRSAEECDCMARALSERIPFPLFLEYANASVNKVAPPAAVAAEIERAMAGCIQPSPQP